MKQTLFAAAAFALTGLHGVSGVYTCCDVIGLSAEELKDDGWVVAPLMLSAYEKLTSEEHYCNLVEIRSEDGTVLGSRELQTAHPDEQPFSRRIGEIVLPAGTDTITAIASDSKYGFCGRSLSLKISGNAPAGISSPPIIRAPVAPITAAPITVGPGTVPTMVAVPTSGGAAGNASGLPSTTPSDMPSFIPSDIPSADSSPDAGEGMIPTGGSPVSTGGSPVSTGGMPVPAGGGTAKPTSSGTELGFCAATLGAAAATLFLL